ELGGAPGLQRDRIDSRGDGVLAQRIEVPVVPEGAGVGGVVAIDAGQFRRVGERIPVLAGEATARAQLGLMAPGLYIAAAEIHLAVRKMEYREHAIAVDDHVAVERGVGGIG